MLAGLIFTASLLIAVLVAFRFGDRDARWTATALAVAAFATPLVTRHSYAGPEVGIIFVDVALLCALLGIVVRSRNFWPLWLAGFHSVTLAVHMAAAAMPHMTPLAYADALTIWAYLMLTTLIYGSLGEGRRKAHPI